ncbi:MAG: hypothetical protein LBF37_00145 [Rickettsiales bacterium]|jgi:hypothetical protein|nr:hypothetical protein [Rickettsiales bacterium]
MANPKTYKVAFSLANFIKPDYFHRILKDRAVLEISDKPDFVFCGIFDQNKFLDYGDKPVRIYFYDENVFPDMNLFDYAIGFQDMSLSGRHLHVPYYYFDFENYKKLLDKTNKNHRFSGTFSESCEPTEPAIFPKENLPNLTGPLSCDPLNRKFCNFIYSNPGNGKLSITRQEFCRDLMTYKHVDCPGRVLNNMQNAIEPRKENWTEGKLDFIKNYKFTIAFENSDSIGYTTEKLIHPLLANSIPIYYGNRNAAADGFNPRAFINGNDFDSLEDLKKFIIELDNDNQKYLEMLREPPLLVDGIPDWDKIIADYIMNILENGEKFTIHGQRLSPFYVLQRNSRKMRKFLVKIMTLFVPNKSKRMQLRQRFGV